jgi:hypothetical protein
MYHLHVGIVPWGSYNVDYDMLLILINAESADATVKWREFLNNNKQRLSSNPFAKFDAFLLSIDTDGHPTASQWKQFVHNYKDNMNDFDCS